MIVTTDRFFEVAVESWLDSALNPRPMNSVQTPLPSELSDDEFNSHSKTTLYS